jgi:TRAP-type C4-dicarboxylate transport system permease large subunit
VAVGWLAGALAFVVVTALGGDLFLRVELGLVAGSVATVAVMTALLVPLLRRHAARGHEAAELLAASSPVAET